MNENVRVYDFLCDDAKNIRNSVFISEQGFKNEFDEIDEKARHIVMYNEKGSPIAVCRIFQGENENSFILGRLAVIPSYRGMNIGKQMIAYAEKAVLSLGGKSLALHAQCRAKAFYEKSGYISYGEIEDDEGCPHIWMKKQL